MRSKSDHALYYETKVEGRLIIGVYVDDMIIMGSNSHKIIKFKEAMKKVFEMTDLDILSFYLGIEIESENFCIWLTQRSYIKNILNMFKMNDCNLVKTHMEFWLILVKDGRGEDKNHSLFQSFIRSLRYLVHSRPDITYNVSYLSIFMHKLTFEHMNTTKRVLRYIEGKSLFDMREEKMLYNSGV